jgi:uncharacterized membrane protein
VLASLSRVRGHPRLFAGIAVSLLAGVLLPDSVGVAARRLIAWNAGTWPYFIASGTMIARATPQSVFSSGYCLLVPDLSVSSMASEFS